MSAAAAAAVAGAAGWWRRPLAKLPFASLLPRRLPAAALPFAGLCHDASAANPGGNSPPQAARADKNPAEIVKGIVEMARLASIRREIHHTDFLAPPLVKEVTSVLEKLADVKFAAQGGYPQAERCRLSAGHPESMETVPIAVAALSVSGNFVLQPFLYDDFLGAILATGIMREKVGDVLLQGEKGAQVLVVPEVVEFLTSTLDKVCNIPVSCKEIPLLALEYEPPRTKSFTTVEASLRVDALASAGFKVSRSKLSDMIRNGEVHVNWSPAAKNGTILKTDDMVSVSGKGKLKIGEIATTKKGKFLVELIRYL